MNREILFRGKDSETGVWREGQYIHLHKTTYCFKEDYDRDPDNDIYQIVFEQMTDWGLPNRHWRADVDPSTVGQYTGLTDKNGKKIFEGDIVKLKDYHGKRTVYIFWGRGVWCYGGDGYSDEYIFNSSKREVLGNIFDNPELLEAAP